MSTAALRAHQVYPLFVNLGGRLAPISIRDQMVRAQMVVDGAIEQGLIGMSPFRPLLVVGAGAAGATAALWASRQSIPTLLIERDRAPFTRQAGCRTRWIDPSQYDWPAAHWNVPLYPVHPTPTPLPWNADLANNLAALWQLRVNSTPFPFFGMSCSTTVTSITPITSPGASPHTMGWRVTVSGSSHTFDFGMVIWTIGFGAERHEVGSYAGFPFWASDPFEMANCGIPNGLAEIVISGSGDGALQDFLRITTNCRSAREVYERCGLNQAQRHEVERVVRDAEDLAHRALLWGPHCRSGHTQNNDHVTLHRLHEVHSSLVEGILGPTGITDSNRAVKRALDSLIRTPLPRIRLVHSCTHFSTSYGLNHFLALLLAHYLRTERGRTDVFIPGRKVASITGIGGHTCSRNWLNCHGEQHEIQLTEALDCRVVPPQANPAEKVVANVVVIRHGIDPSILPPFLDVTIPRQTIPYSALH